MAQNEGGPGRNDPTNIPTVASNVKHAGGAVTNPAALAVVVPAQSHPGVPRQFF